MRNRFVFVAGMLVLVNSGCLFHGATPYGYNNYYGTGPSVLPPQQPYGFPSGQPLNQPYYPPAGTSPTPLNGGNPTYTPNGGTLPEWQPQPTYQTPAGGNNNSAPPFNPTSPGTGGGTGVPEPLDDRTPTTQRPGGLTPTTSTSRVNEDESTPFTQEESTRLPRKFQDADVVEAEEPFQTPVRQTSGFGDGEVQQANRTTLTPQVSSKAYGHDPQFQWVKGVVEFDEPSKTWVIMYDNNPQPSDPYGGELTLADDPSLKRLRTEDKVMIDGALDEDATDRRGIPMFRIARLKKQK